MNIDKITEQYELVSVVTVGRLGFMETFRNINLTSFKMRIPTMQTGGAYWNQGITRGVEMALKNNPRFLLFYDGDSVFEPEDVDILYTLIKDNLGVDAVCPVQADRNGAWQLAFGWNNRTLGPYDYSGETTLVPHGHFGCTIIRAEAFMRIAKPWFIGVPGADGTWDGPGKRDDDTNFWFKFNEAKLNLYQANKVVIGHMELHVRWQDGPEVIPQTLTDFNKHGKPKGLRSPLVDEIAPRLDTHQLPPGAPEKHEYDHLIFCTPEQFVDCKKALLLIGGQLKVHKLDNKNSIEWLAHKRIWYTTRTERKGT